MKKLILCAAFLCVTNVLAAESFEDTRDGQTYKTIKVGKQVWMAQNLNYETRNSECFKGKAENCENFGRKYSKSAAQKACPDGWHLPSISEFRKAVKASGGKRDVDNKSIWYEVKPVANITAGPEDFCNTNGSDPNVDDSEACFWTSSESSGSNYDIYLTAKAEIAAIYGGFDYNYFSVRCVKDEK